MKTLLAKNRVQEIKKKLNNNSDIIIKNIVKNNQTYCLIFVDELTDQEAINFNIINSLIAYSSNKKLSLEEIKDKAISNCIVEIINKDIIKKILKGFVIMFVDGYEEVLCFNVVKYEGRNISEPPSSTVINGPREGFTENIKLNLSLMRKRIISEKFKIEDYEIGDKTKTSIKILYLKDIAKEKVIEIVRKKLLDIKIDGILDSYYIGTFLENKKNSIFRQVGICEKPDIACAKMLEGRIIILVDGSPIALTVPFILFEDFQSSNDYYSEAHRATFLRVLRVIAVMLSIYLPGMYIALQLYHYKVLPLKFLVTIINTTQNLPLNPFLEIFFIIVLFDILFEASVRMPRYLGIAVSIVGALILGETAVSAGLVSPPGVMIVAMSAITIYIIPNQGSQISLLRFIFALIGALLGFHGIILGTMFLIAYLANFDSYGTPYLAPFTPFILRDQKDGIIKESIVNMDSLPKSIPAKKNKRQEEK